MSSTVTGTISDFYEKSTKEFQVSFIKDAVSPDITLDEVRLFVKANKTDTDANAKVNKIADVSTAGASGVALFEITPTESTLTVGKYWYQIIWTENSGQVHAMKVESFKILDAIYEV